MSYLRKALGKEHSLACLIDDKEDFVTLESADFEGDTGKYIQVSMVFWCEGLLVVEKRRAITGRRSCLFVQEDHNVGGNTAKERMP